MRTPRLAFSRLADAPAAGSIQFYDGFYCALGPGSYTITVKQAVTPPSGQPAPEPYQLAQAVMVQAPQFAIGADAVQAMYPPDGSADGYDQQLPFIVLAEAALPWERPLVPGSTTSPSSPWMALVLFAENELAMVEGTDDPVVNCTVQQLLAPQTGVLKPQIDIGQVPASLQAMPCQTITIPGALFNAVMPTQSDLPYLAHCRAVNTAGENPGLVAVVVANRIPRPDTSVSPAAPCRYHAHLVSLEGFASYLGPNSPPLPSQASGGGLVNVQMVSLAAWSFVSLPGGGLAFGQLVGGLVASEGTEGSAAALALPPLTPSPPTDVTSRLEQGYVPLALLTQSGDQSFAWYRGPFTAALAQPLPQAGNPAMPVSQASSADALWIYLAAQGIFDLSYAAAWNLGRLLALADASFAETLHLFGQRGRAAVNALAQRWAMPHLADEGDAAALLAPGASRTRLARQAVDLTQAWSGAMASVRTGLAPGRAAAGRAAAPHPRELLAKPTVREALQEHLADSVPAIAAWLAGLTLLQPVPFSHLVPDGRMLPVESIRFFYVDPGWLDALTAGAMSIAAKTGADTAIVALMRPDIDAAVGAARASRVARAAAPDADAPAPGQPPAAGLLIRSALVSGWPSFAIQASANGNPVSVLRDDCLSPDVRLCLFDAVPDTITLAEPGHALRFGIDANGIAPRYVTAAGAVGAQIAGASPVPASGGYAAFLAAYGRSAAGGVLDVAALAAALASAAGASASAFGAGAYAIQLLQAPALQAFTANAS